jgi:mannose PTS system EIIA component
MLGLMIIAHTPLASSLKTVAQHVFPDCTQWLEALDVAPDMSLDVVESQARKMLERVRGPEVLIFTDVFGATPCNVAQRLADGAHVRVIAGVNVPMLWRALCYLNEPLEAVVMRAMAGATQGVMQVAVSKPQIQTNHPSRHDQDDPHHQQ